MHKPALYLISTAGSYTGGERSMAILCQKLSSRFSVHFRGINEKIHPEIEPILEKCAVDIEMGLPHAVELPEGGHALIHCHEYAMRFKIDVDLWRRKLSKLATVQMIFNVDMAGVYHFDWLADNLTGVYFENHSPLRIWKGFSRNRALANTRCVVLPPPLDINPFLQIDITQSAERKIIGRLAGHAPMPTGFKVFYENLFERLPEWQFWFMTTANELREAFEGHPRVRLLRDDELTPVKFLESVDFICYPLRDHWPANGPRSLVESVAAGHAVVTVDRAGPKERVQHGESGFLANSLERMADYVVQLANDPGLRLTMGRRAKQLASTYNIMDWVDEIEIGTHAKPASQCH